MIQYFLEGRPLQDIDAEWVGDIVAENPALKDQVLGAARGGDEQALEALAWAKYQDDADQELRAAATTIVTRFTHAVTREESVDGTRPTVAHHIGIRFELGGLLASFAHDDARTDLAARLREIILDDADTESSRASAVNALFNMAEQLDEPVRAELADDVRPLVFGDYQPNELEHSEVDPLSRFQMSHDVVDSLRASAVGLAARLSALGTELDYLQDAVNQGLVHPTPRVQAAALDTLARVSSLTAPPDLAALLGHSDDQVARQTVKALAAHQPKWLSEKLTELTQHASYSVRMLVLMIAKENGHAEALASMAEADPNAYLRGLADMDLRALEAEGQLKELP